MSSDTEKHREPLNALKAAQRKGDGSFDHAVTGAFERVFEHLERLNSHVSLVGSNSESRPLKVGESATLR